MPFIAHQVALEAIRLLRPLIAKIRVKDRELARQLSDSSKSAALNLAEGSGKRYAARANCYRISCGETMEARMALDVAVAAGYLSEAEIEDAWRCLDRGVGIIWPLIK